MFFERNRKIPLCFFIFPEGPRVTEVTKLEILKSVRRLGIYNIKKMIRYAVVLENGLLYELVGRLGVKKQKKKWKTCVANNFSP